jgi:hypothetical protein
MYSDRVIFKLDADTGQPILNGGDLVRHTDPLEILAQRIRFRLRTLAGELLNRTDLGLPDDQLLEKGVTPLEVANIVRDVLRTVPGILSIDSVTPAAEPTAEGMLAVEIVVTADAGSLTLTVEI